MIEAAISTFAPTVGLSSSNYDGCGYSGARQMLGSFKVLEKTASVQEAAHATATDLVTLDSEFFKLKTIIPYSYHVLENGVWVNGGRTLEEINDPDQVDGERIKRVMEVQNAMASDQNIIQAAVASEDFGSGRNYLYLFTKDLSNKNRINALAIEHQGNKDEFQNLLRALSPSVNNPSLETPLFFNWQDQVLLSDVFRGVLDSYGDPKRREEMKPYLTRLAHDTADFPNLLEKHRQAVDTLTKKFQEEILASENIVAGLSAVVHGINKTVEDWIDRDREKYQERLGINSGRLVPMSRRDVSRTNPKRSEESYSPSLHAKSLHSCESSENIFLKGKKALEEVFGPAVPVIMGIIKNLTSKNEDSKKSSEKETVEAGREKTADVNKKDDNRKEVVKVWRKIIEFIFAPVQNEESVIEIRLSRYLSITDCLKTPPMVAASDADSSDGGGIKKMILSRNSCIYPNNLKLSALKHLKGDRHSQTWLGRLTSRIDSFPVEESADPWIRGIERIRSIFPGDEEEKEKIKDSFQIVLEILLANDNNEKPSKFMLERDFGRLPGQDLAQAIAKEEGMTYLSLLLEVYDRLSQREEIKEFIVALIYHHIRQSVPDVSLDISSEEVDVLTSKIDFLRKRLIQVLQPPLDNSCEIDTELIFILYSLTLAILDLPRLEILPHINLLTSLIDAKDGCMDDYRSWLIDRLNNLRPNLFGKKLSKKKRKKLPLYATLFFYQVVYQYQDTCQRVLKMPQ